MVWYYPWLLVYFAKFSLEKGLVSTIQYSYPFHSGIRKPVIRLWHLFSGVVIHQYWGGDCLWKECLDSTLWVPWPLLWYHRLVKIVFIALCHRSSECHTCGLNGMLCLWYLGIWSLRYQELNILLWLL